MTRSSAERFDMRVELLATDGGNGGHAVQATVHLPGAGIALGALIVAVPGASYGRNYYDLPATTSGDYSMSRFLNATGDVVVACDPVGTGDSTLPDGATVSLAVMADSVAAALPALIQAVRAGLGRPDWNPLVVGLGHSMGGCLITLAQARHDVFDAVALWGWSAVEVVMPQPPAGSELVTDASSVDNVPGTPEGYLQWDPRPPSVEWAFHLGDTDPAVLARDRPTPFPAAAMAQMAGPGVVAADAASIAVPVLLAFGERDVAQRPHAEVACYPASPYVTLAVIPGAAHCHNFARTRTQLWAYLAAWTRTLRATRAGPSELS